MNKNKNVGCDSCFDVGQEYIIVESGKKICSLCEGTILTLQEAFDKIAELKSELAIYKREGLD